MKRKLNVGDRIEFVARVRGRGWRNTAAIVDTPQPLYMDGVYSGKVVSFSPRYNMVCAMTNRGHVFEVAL